MALKDNIVDAKLEWLTNTFHYEKYIKSTGTQMYKWSGTCLIVKQQNITQLRTADRLRYKLLIT